jgi:hypothetical protein
MLLFITVYSLSNCESSDDFQADIFGRQIQKSPGTTRFGQRRDLGIRPEWSSGFPQWCGHRSVSSPPCFRSTPLARKASMHTTSRWNQKSGSRPCLASCRHCRKFKLMNMEFHHIINDLFQISQFFRTSHVPIWWIDDSPDFRFQFIQTLGHGTDIVDQQLNQLAQQRISPIQAFPQHAGRHAHQHRFHLR